jgi:1-acyl-sn-glycerol-3-phosphate acyltransferase
LVYLLKIIVRLALRIFCPEIHIPQKDFLNPKGPVLLLANHPDSFLDAVIIGAAYQRKIHFLARGDVFEHPIYGFLLRSIGMIPVFRAREGKQHLHRNQNTFQESVDILAKGGAVLIFIEGICLNTHEIQAFKKGAARILAQTQAIGVFPLIHVIGLGYNDFAKFGKKVNLHIDAYEEKQTIATPKDYIDFNERVMHRMRALIEIPKGETRILKGISYAFHWPFYALIRQFVYEKTNHTVFYDSVLFGVLLFTYPIYLLILGCLLSYFQIPGPVIVLVLFWMPISARLSLK